MLTFHHPSAFLIARSGDNSDVLKIELKFQQNDFKKVPIFNKVILNKCYKKEHFNGIKNSLNRFHKAKASLN